MYSDKGKEEFELELDDSREDQRADDNAEEESAHHIANLSLQYTCFI